MRKHDRYLLPRRLQMIGVSGLIFFAGFWAATGRQSALLVGAFGGMALLSNHRRLIRAANELLAEETDEAAE